MRSVCLLALAVFLAGCGSRPVDISDAYWTGRNDPRARDPDGWPLWDKAPQKGVKIGEPSSPEADRLEYVGFLWDETGLYGRVLAFEFPQIDIVPSSDEQSTVIVRAATPGQMRRTLGEISAWSVAAGQREVLGSSEFRSIDRAWVMKPGQCQSEFWVSWQAIGSDGPPKEPLTVRVRQRNLTLNADGKAR